MLLINVCVNIEDRNKQLSSYGFLFGCCFKDSASTSTYPSWWKIKIFKSQVILKSSFIRAYLFITVFMIVV